METEIREKATLSPILVLPSDVYGGISDSSDSLNHVGEMTQLQEFNIAAFVISMAANGLSYVWPGLPSLNYILAEWDIKFAPATWAFGIWSLIYSLMMVFVIYQALPKSWVPNRHDDVIFGESGISWFFIYNMIANGAWLFIFQQDNTVGFAVSLLVNVIILVTDLIMMKRSGEADLSTIEWISMRGGFSIYAGWVTAAFILNVAFLLKSLGMADPNILNGEVTEEQVTILVLWVAFAIYNLESHADKNVLYGSVFFWVLAAVRDHILNDEPEYSAIAKNALIIGCLHVLSMGSLLWHEHRQEMSQLTFSEHPKVPELLSLMSQIVGSVL